MDTETGHYQRMIFSDRAFLYGMYADGHPFRVVRKAVQVYMTEAAYLQVVDWCRAGYHGGYILPTLGEAQKFVQQRIKTSILRSPYYQYLMRGAAAATQSVDIRNIGLGSVTFIGARVKSALAGHDWDFYVSDEHDFNVLGGGQATVDMARDRVTASMLQASIIQGNPQASQVMVDGEYRAGDQRIWVAKCPHCGRWQPYSFFAGVVRQIEEWKYILRDATWAREDTRDIHYMCRYCTRPMPRFGLPSEWVAMFPGREVHSYWVNQIMAPNLSLRQMSFRFFNEAVRSIDGMQQFWATTEGKGYSQARGEITEAMLQDCVIALSERPANWQKTTVMGIDVGKLWLYVVIARVWGEWLILEHWGKYKDVDEVYRLINRYKVLSCLMDAQPEYRTFLNLREKSAKTRRVTWGLYYLTGPKQRAKVDQKNHLIHDDRTFMIDQVYAHIVDKLLILPGNALIDKELKEHLTSSVRVEIMPKNSDVPMRGWERKRGMEDHFLHALAAAIRAKLILDDGLMGELANASHVPGDMVDLIAFDRPLGDDKSEERFRALQRERFQIEQRWKTRLDVSLLSGTIVQAVDICVPEEYLIVRALLQELINRCQEEGRPVWKAAAILALQRLDAHHEVDDHAGNGERQRDDLGSGSSEEELDADLLEELA
jgi:hypothetical protein